ncbi:MAG: recO [Frankiales bacterium]|nr:recO [Frankiales bacterium]
MALYRDEGVVLRVQKLGEADRIVTVLTRRHGRVRAVAKGVRRTRSKFGASVEPFSHVDLQLYEGRSLDIVTQAESLTAYGDRLAGDYGRYTAGTAVLETAERLTAEEREPSLKLFLLVIGALRALCGGGPEALEPRDPSLVLDAFLLRAMSVAGYAPALADCARCGATGPHRAFSVPAGGTVCPACRPSGAASPAPSALSLMTALMTGDWDAAETTDARTRREASGLVSAHLQWHLERGLRSLPLVER